MDIYVKHLRETHKEKAATRFERFWGSMPYSRWGIVPMSPESKNDTLSASGRAVLHSTLPVRVRYHPTDLWSLEGGLGRGTSQAQINLGVRLNRRLV